MIDNLNLGTPNLLGEGQDPSTVERILSHVKDILVSSETIDYVAVQKRSVTRPIPDAVILTSKRLILYRPKLLGRIRFKEYAWRDLADAHLQEGILGSTLTLQVVDGATISLDRLPKAQARRLYGLSQEREEEVREERRTWELEARRAVAGGGVVHGVLPGSRPFSRSASDPVERLQKLEDLLDAGLISIAEYRAKRAEILSRM